MSDFNVYRSSQPSRDMCPTFTTLFLEFKDHYGDFDFSPFSYQDIAMKRVLGTEKGKNTNE